MGWLSPWQNAFSAGTMRDGLLVMELPAFLMIGNIAHRGEPQASGTFGVRHDR